MKLKFWIHASLALSCLCASQLTVAQTTLYRCTNAQGDVSVQSAVCASGLKQETLRVGEVPTQPLPKPAMPPPIPKPKPSKAPSPANATRPPPAFNPNITDPAVGCATQPSVHPTFGATAKPPPILFQCTTYQRGTYLTEEAQPQSRCAPIQPEDYARSHLSNGYACELIYDVCGRIPDEQLCTSWQKRLDETEVAWRFARPENIQKNKTEYERVLRIVTESNCNPSTTGPN